MNQRQTDMRLLYQWLDAPEDLDQTGAERPSLLPWLGYALLGLLAAIMLTATVLALLPIG